MNLLLWRHAEAEEGSPDFQRMLTPHGRNQASKAGNWIRRNAPSELRLLVSPTKRTRQTADALGVPYVIDENIAPGASLEQILDTIGIGPGKPKPREDLLLVGHQPWIGQTAAYLLTGQSAEWSVRKGAVWWFVWRNRPADSPWTLRTVIDASFL